MPIYANNTPITSKDFTALFKLPTIPVAVTHPAQLTIDNTLMVLQGEKAALYNDPTLTAVTTTNLNTCLFVILIFENENFTMACQYLISLKEEATSAVR